MNQIITAMSRSLHGSAVVLSILLANVGCNPSGPANAISTWKTFSPPGGNFSVMMPPNPVEKIPKTKSGFEEKSYTIVSAMSNLAGMAVGYSDQPNTGVFEKDPQKILDAVRKSSLENLRGQLISEQAITHKNYPGREFVASIPGGYTVRQRIFLVKKRMYSLMVTAGTKGLESPEAKTFFDSFQILN